MESVRALADESVRCSPINDRLRSSRDRLRVFR